MIPALLGPAIQFVWSRCWVGAILALGASTALQTHRLNSVKAELQTERKARSEETEMRRAMAAEHRTVIAALKRQHDAQTQEKENAFNSDTAALRAVADRRAADARSLRDQLAAATRRDPADQAGPAACQRDADRLEALGALAGEGVEVVAEARRLLDQRDLEVKRLLDQIAIDRAACQSPG